MRNLQAIRCALLLFVAILGPMLTLDPSVRRVLADPPFVLSSVPYYTQEGNLVSLILTANSVIGGTRYQFVFAVKDPRGSMSQSPPQNYTVPPGQTQFSIRVIYPSTTFPAGTTDFAGRYNATVDLVGSVIGQIAQTDFYIEPADSSSYERTQTVNVQASGYSPLESVTVDIKAQSTSTLVFSQAVTPTTGGVVVTSWKIPRNATIGNYLLTLTGTTTVKSPSDTQTILINPATMSIPAITSNMSTFQRTMLMQFSFQPTYPDGSMASTGVALLTLTRPSGKSVTLTATYDNTSQTFETNYQTTRDNQTGTWTASLTGHAYSDAFGNTGPGTPVSTKPQLVPATLTVTVGTVTSFTVGQQLRFNATITYPDGTTLTSGSLGAFLLLSGTQPINETVPVVFDTGLNLWIGTYTWQSKDTGGLWSLIVRASDSPSPPNTGSATRAISLQNNTSGSTSFPLYFFGIIAALIAAALLGFLLAFRRRKETHARLKIDLEAVKSEAGRIEDQEFFQSIKDQVKKEKED